MKPLFVRELSGPERHALQTGLRSSDGFTVRRCHILLASARGDTTTVIAQAVGCSPQAVRNVLRAFETRGLAVVAMQSRRPHTAVKLFDAERRQRLKALLHQSPRQFGKARSTWTLALAAEVCVEQGVTAERVSLETIRDALKRLGVGWRRAKTWITSPDPQASGWGSAGGERRLGSPARTRKTRSKKWRDRLISLATRHPDWVVGYADEVWWSRLAQPAMHAWGETLRLETKARAKDDPQPKALACYGLLRTDQDRVLLRFVEGRPVSRVTTEFLAWAAHTLAKDGKRVWVLVWDNAAWHVSRAVQAWIGTHNRTVKRTGGVRILVCRLPVKSPWLNPIEPRWLHGKRAIVEPDQTLAAHELMDRVHQDFGCERREPRRQHGL